MIDILNKKVFRLDDYVYFLLSSIDKPHLYIKCYGKIIKKHTNNDNTIYLIELKKFLLNVDGVKHRLHRRTFKTRKKDTLQAVTKKVYCSELLDDFPNFNNKISTYLTDYLFVLPSVFVCETIEELDEIFNISENLIKEELRLRIKEMEL